MKPLEYEPVPQRRSPGVWRRLPTTLALGGVIAVIGLFGAMWLIALVGGEVDLLWRHYRLRHEFRGNHGPWRHDRVLATLYDCAFWLTIFGLLPTALLGGLLEPTRRAAIVAAAALLLVFVNLAHFPLFD